MATTTKKRTPRAKKAKVVKLVRSRLSVLNLLIDPKDVTTQEITTEADRFNCQWVFHLGMLKRRGDGGRVTTVVAMRLPNGDIALNSGMHYVLPTAFRSTIRPLVKLSFGLSDYAHRQIINGMITPDLFFENTWLAISRAYPNLLRGDRAIIFGLIVNAMLPGFSALPPPDPLVTNYATDIAFVA